MYSKKQLILSADKAFHAGHLKDSINALTALIKLEPSKVEWLEKRAIAYLHQENFSEALVDISKVVEKEPCNQSALSNMGVALMKTNNLAHAKEILEFLLELNPNSYEANLNLTTVYQSLGMPNEQIKAAIKSVEINPKSATAFNNLASAFGDRGMNKECREALLIAKELDPFLAPTLINLALLEFRIGNSSGAIENYEKIFKLKNLSNETKRFVEYSSSFAYLSVGQLEKGWKFYESGFGSLGNESASRSVMPFPEPKWRGEELVGKSLFIIREQGLGDELMFSTCFAELELLNADITIKCEPRLETLFSRTYPRLRFIPDTDLKGFIGTSFDHNKFDYLIAMGSLPGIFRNDIGDFKNSNKYLIPNDQLLEDYRARMAHYSGKKLIGICWRSGFLDVTRNEGYSVLTDWDVLLTKPDAIFVNLQYGDCENELIDAEKKFGIKILRWSDTDLKNDLERVVAIMHNLDEVVSVNSAPFSLSGASGVKTFLLTPEVWTMCGEKDKFPWYESVLPITYKVGEEHVLKGLPAVLQMI
jgi:tetratricopeptide (TPR) repeat protein